MRSRVPCQWAPSVTGARCLGGCFDLLIRHQRRFCPPEPSSRFEWLSNYSLFPPVRFSAVDTTGLKERGGGGCHTPSPALCPQNQQVTPESCSLLARAGWDKTDSGAEAVVAARAALLAGPLLRSVFLLARGARGEQGDTGGGSTGPLGDRHPSQV